MVEVKKPTTSMTVEQMSVMSVITYDVSYVKKIKRMLENMKYDREIMLYYLNLNDSIYNRTEKEIIITKDNAINKILSRETFNENFCCNTALLFYPGFNSFNINEEFWHIVYPICTILYVMGSRS